MLLAAAAVRGGEQGPAVGGDLQGGSQGGQDGVLMPGGVGDSSWQGGGWGHLASEVLLAFASGRTPGSLTSYVSAPSQPVRDWVRRIPVWLKYLGVLTLNSHNHRRDSLCINEFHCTRELT